MSIKKITSALLLGAVVITCGTGCQRKIGGNQYSSASLNSASQTYQGIIMSVRKVEVSEAERLQDNTTGMGVGALAGGLAGSAFGKGKGKIVGVGLGALAGGAAGMFAQEAMGTQTGIEYVVKLSNGNLMTIVQGDDTMLPAGKRVLVMIPTASGARPRVVADDSGMPMEVQEMKPMPGQNSPMIVINNSTGK
jgi:outer membrane lipoprotein SlyB